MFILRIIEGWWSVFVLVLNKFAKEKNIFIKNKVDKIIKGDLKKTKITVAFQSALLFSKHMNMIIFP